MSSSARIFALCFMLGASSLLAQTASVSIDASVASGSPAIAGTNIQFSLTASNEGPDDAMNVVMTFDTPTNTTFVSLTAPAGWSCTTPGVGATGTITCSTADLPTGSAVQFLTTTTPSSTPRGTVIELDGTISSTTPDPNLNDNSVTRTVPVDWVSSLAVTKAGPASANAGTTFNYTISINDQGPSSAGDLTFTDVLPSSLLFSSISAPGWSCTPPAVGTNGTVTCTISSIPVGITTLTLAVSTAASTAATNVENDITVDSDTDPMTPRTATATTAIATSADVTISKTSPATVFAGESLPYTIVVGNNGPSDAQSLTLTDVLPAAVGFQAISATGWTCNTPAVGTSGTVTCMLATLAASASSTITITTSIPSSAPSGTTISNTATVTSTTSDPATPNTSTANNTVSVHTDLAITIADSPDPVNAGANITYTVVATNNGTGDAASASVSVPLGASLAFVSTAPQAGWSCTNPVVGASGTVNCTIASFPASTSATFTIVASVRQGTAGGTSITTSASVSSATTETALGNNNASTSTAVLSPANVSATKSTGAGQTFETQPVSYTVVLTNNSSSTQTDNPGDEMTDVLPPSLTLTSAGATAGTAVADIPNNTVHWNGSIPNAGSVTVTINATVNSGTAGTTISNTATTHFDGDGNGTNESSGTSNTVSFTPLPATAIPTLSTLLLAALASMLALLGATRLRG